MTLSLATAPIEPPREPVDLLVGAATEVERPNDEMIERRYSVTPNIVDLARGNPRIRATLPGGDVAEFRLHAFDAERGFEIADDGTIIPSEVPNKLAYFVSATGPRERCS